MKVCRFEPQDTNPLASLGVFFLRHVSQVFEARKLTHEGELYGTRGAIALLGDDHLGDVGDVVAVAIDVYTQSVSSTVVNFKIFMDDSRKR